MKYCKDQFKIPISNYIRHQPKLPKLNLFCNLLIVMAAHYQCSSYKNVRCIFRSKVASILYYLRNLMAYLNCVLDFVFVFSMRFLHGSDNNKLLKHAHDTCIHANRERRRLHASQFTNVTRDDSENRTKIHRLATKTTDSQVHLISY